MNTLHVVATPIGNLDDITLRAIKTLQSVDTVLCEDTRVTGKLLAHMEIKKPLLSYHANSKLSKSQQIIELLKKGKDLALVSDAGTPTISDPGVQLIQMVREQLPEVKISPVPGASALITALSGAGFAGNEFVFYGFIPHKKGRKTLFKEISDNAKIGIMYESPHRVMKTLGSLVEHLGSERRICVARELTKIYEDFVSGTAQEVFDHYTEHADQVRGEFVVMVDKT